LQDNGAEVGGTKPEDESILPVLRHVVDDAPLQFEGHDFQKKSADR
jgi:hypothetical protein